MARDPGWTRRIVTHLEVSSKWSISPIVVSRVLGVRHTEGVASAEASHVSESKSAAFRVVFAVALVGAMDAWGGGED